MVGYVAPQMGIGRNNSPINSLFGWILKARPLILHITSDRIKLLDVKTGATFDEPPVIAIREERGRKIVHAIGDSARVSDCGTVIEIREPFKSVEPLFADLDASEAIVKHAIREVFKSHWLLAPKMFVLIPERKSVLSDVEQDMLHRFFGSCGVSKAFIYIGDSNNEYATDHAIAPLESDADYCIST